MSYNPTVHINNFNDRVRVMNQTRSAEMRLTAIEANNLQADITAMLAEIARLSIVNNEASNEVVQISMNGGSF